MKHKIIHFSPSDLNGGAAITAFRIHIVQLKSGLNTNFLVQSKYGNNPCAISLIRSPFVKIMNYVRSVGDKELFAV